MLAAVTVVVYVVLAVRGDDVSARTVLAAATLSLAVVGAAVAREQSGTPALLRGSALGVSVGALMTWAFVAGVAVGVPLFIAGLLVLAGGQELLDEAMTRRTAAAASLATVGTLVLGLSLT